MLPALAGNENHEKAPPSRWGFLVVAAVEITGTSSTLMASGAQLLPLGQ
jgi:hypothetical protein